MTIAVAKSVTYGHDASLARFSVSRFQKMIDAGVLTDDDKVELLENYVVLKMPRNARHDSSVQRILRPVLQVLPAAWDVRVQSAITLDDSQPEPDFAIVRGTAADYAARHPGPDDIGLLIEVADPSLARDQHDKSRIYARSGIPLYWIINLVDHQIEVHSEPSGLAMVPAYGRREIRPSGDQIDFVLRGAVVAQMFVSDLLP